MNEQAGAIQEQRRPGFLGVHSLDPFSLTVADLAEAIKFYATFGLDARPEGNGVALYTFGHPHRWGVLQQGKRKQFGYLSFGIYDNDQSAFRDRLGRMNIQCIPPPRGSGSDGIWFRDEEGNLIEEAVRPKSSPLEKSRFHDVSSPATVAGPRYAALRRLPDRGG